MEINIGKLTVDSFMTSNFFEELEQIALAGQLDAEVVITDQAKVNAKIAVANCNNNNSSNSDDAEMSERVREFLDEYELKSVHIYYGDDESADRKIVMVVQREDMQLRVKAVLSYAFDVLTYLEISECRGYDKEKARDYINELADVLLDKTDENDERDTREKVYDFDLML